MRRVTPVLIVNNDCSHGPSPRCCDAVPLSIVVAPPPVTLRRHRHRRALQNTNAQHGQFKSKYIKGALKNKNWNGDHTSLIYESDFVKMNLRNSEGDNFGWIIVEIFTVCLKDFKFSPLLWYALQKNNDIKDEWPILCRDWPQKDTNMKIIIKVLLRGFLLPIKYDIIVVISF